jgi:Mg2+/Co2+ transporter CorB
MRFGEAGTAVAFGALAILSIVIGPICDQAAARRE